MRFRLLAVALLTLLAGGCVGVPQGGRVLSGNAGGTEQPVDDPFVGIIPVGPARDWSPIAIVEGFRTASSSFDGPNGDHQVARSYLACVSCWRPGVASIVYSKLDPPSYEQDGPNRATVTLQGTQLGQIGADGQYIADARDFKQVFHLRQDAQRQWRITDLPSELLLSRDDVTRAFRTLDLYFFAPDSQMLVPNPVFIPLVSRSWLPTQLVKQLIGGPTTWLKSALVRSAFPVGTRLRGLRIDGGVATVDLTRQARAGDLNNMSIQLMWTLRQLREVQRMELRIDGKPVDVPGVSGALQSTRDWAAYNPNGGGEPQPAYVRLADGRLGRLDAARASAVPTKVQAGHPAISYDDRQVASLNDAADTVTVTDLIGGAVRTTLRATAKGGRFTPPSWDSRGNVWVVESTKTGSQLWVIEGGTRSVAVDGWALAQYPVKTLRIARDGTRAAVIVKVDGRWQVQLGRVDRAPSGGLQAEGFISISSELQSAIDLTWSTTDHLAVVGMTQGNPSPSLFDVPVSGAPISPMIGPGGEITTITASPGSPLLVTQRISGDKTLNVCRLSVQYDEWKCFNGTSNPAYPG
ncbi:LpqB family beta-propeller domain-containing protein [Actinoallomurus rhizosphaericola]|uniref:LpqB family beta-propeller domain-containing protein n=1 Tax=Actinoallomurus rhizosphaericola TaxID=2952536 RepID=UPI0020929CED|nr:LpqB family beta-propeller domain-containing protein [Actinoallomurus rhizosphaericola]MCO5998755.1 LpqB family beta-propeller domain-containing protein [Actinoallomurus rhizosphaericola]